MGKHIRPFSQKGTPIYLLGASSSSRMVGGGENKGGGSTTKRERTNTKLVLLGLLPYGVLHGTGGWETEGGGGAIRGFSYSRREGGKSRGVKKLGEKGR